MKRPNVTLSGHCSIGFAFYYVKHCNNQLIYNDFVISLEECNHIAFLEFDSIILSMKDGNKINLKPVEYKKWKRYLPKWIRYIRHVPLWQIIIELIADIPMSWGLLKLSDTSINVLLCLIGPRFHYYKHYNDKIPMASIDVAKAKYVDNTLIMDGWEISFETKELGDKWERELFIRNDIMGPIVR